ESALSLMAAGKRGQVLVIDAREVAEVRAAVDAAHTRAPRAVVLVFAEESAEKLLGAALKGSKVFALLPLPLDAPKTQAGVEGAVAEAVAKRAPAAPPADPPTEGRSELSVGAFQPRPAAASAERTRGGSSRMLLILAAASVLAVAGGATWYFTRSERTVPAP